MIDEAQLLGGPQVRDAGDTTISALGLMTGRTLKYLFDFGDEWWHDVTVEQTDGELGPAKYPQVIEKHGASPPQYPEPEEDDGDEE